MLNSSILPLLWTNPNPSLPFDAQIIELDLSSYNYVLIEFENTNGYIPRAYLRKGDQLVGAGYNNVGVAPAARNFSWVDKGIQVLDGYYASMGMQNTMMVPVHIYGGR